MPEYTYICDQGHIEEVTEPMVQLELRFCRACGGIAWRRPNLIAINWNGLRPSAGELSPEIKQLIDSADQRRDDYRMRKELTGEKNG